MTRPASPLSHLPGSSTDMTTEDRVTYRKWAYGWLIAYAAVLGTAITFSIATRPERRLQASRTIGLDAVMHSTASPPMGGRPDRHR
jgi:hypothetical protein